jgi:hypothetical protein
VLRRYERSLADLVEQRGGPLSIEEIRRHGLVLARTLAQLHGAGVLLQDIKVRPAAASARALTP